MSETPRSQKTGMVKKLGAILLVVAMVAALFIYRDKLASLFGPAGGDKGQPSWEEKIATLKNEIASKPGDQGPGQPPAGDAATPLLPAAGPASEPLSPKEEAGRLAAKLLSFFHHLDRQDYFISYQIKEGSQAHLRAVLVELFDRPPVVARETDDLMDVLHNVAHFFRVLGKIEVALAKDVLLREEEDMEELLAMFYRWSELGDQYQGRELQLRLPLPGLYEYAGFFLNTLGGQAYLFRRDPKVRILVKYYAVQIVDRADRQKINRHGIDIRPAIDSLIEEMNAYQNLQNRQYYLQSLFELQSAYQARRE